ncbi:MAG TPA: hypothetical protein VHH36_08860, partial [Candidatus Thermoplasmatota archaeon]|nr:hypothetical protein [Candidatus Thermoplasmatota archaeon]
VRLTLASLPRDPSEANGRPYKPGIYQTHVPVEVVLRASAGNGLVSPLWRNYTLPLQLTVGFAAELDVANLSLEEGSQVWLIPPTFHSEAHAGHLLHDAWPGGPAANATVVDGRARFDLVGDVHYAIAVPAATGLPVDTTLGTREGGRPHGVYVLAGEARLNDVANRSKSVTPLPASARLPTPVAYRFLDVLDGTDVAMDAIVPPSSVEDVLRAPAVQAGAWDRRGDPERASGRALDEPLPLGETPFGWSLRHVDRAPPTILGDQDGAATRRLYERQLDDSQRHAYTAAAGHLDTRPYAAEGRADLPWVRLATSFVVPQPADDLHGFLLLPLTLAESTAIVRVTLGDRHHTFPVTRDGVWLPVSDAGLTWSYAPDLLDDAKDDHEGGAMLGFGHRHAMAPPRASPVPPTPAGYRIPVSFHDLGDDATMEVTVLVRPDPAPRETALSATPWTPAPGPRFVLDGVALYAWTSAMAGRLRNETVELDAGDLSRFVPDDGREVPKVRAAPYLAGAALVPEFLEVYARGGSASLRAVGADGNVSAGTLVRGVADARDATYPLGRAFTPVYAPDLHPVGVIEAYGNLTITPSAGYPTRVRFADTGEGVWRVGVEDLRAASDDGRFRLYSEGLGGSPTLDVATEPFGDALDGDRPPADHEDYCLLYPFVALVSSDVARQACFEAVDLGAGPVHLHDETHDHAHAQALAADVAAPARAPGPAPMPVAASGAATAPTPTEAEPAPRPCMDGEFRASCVDGVVEALTDAAGDVLVRLGILPDLTVGSGACPAGGFNATCTLFHGRVPQHGALLLLRHAFAAEGADPRGHLNVTIAFATHGLPTIEGSEILRASDGAPRGDRLDVFDLAPFGGETIKVTATPIDARWSASWRVVARAPDDVAPRVDDPRLAARASPALPAEGLQPIPDGPAVTAGPAQADRAEAAGPGRVNLPRGLDVTRSANVSGKLLVLGGDARGNALVTVRAGATLALEDVVAVPRSARAAWGIVVEPGATLALRNVTLYRGGSGESGMAAVDLRGAGVFEDVQIVGGATGVRVGEGATLDADGLTLARLATGLLVDGGRADVSGALVAMNRDGGVVAQDSLVAVQDVRFAWNGDAGPGAALASVEGLGNGRVVAHAVRFADNAQAVDVRGRLDLHDAVVRMGRLETDAIRVRPDAWLRFDGVSLASPATALRLDAGAHVEGARSSLLAPAAFDCAQLALPEPVSLSGVAYSGVVDAACGGRVPGSSGGHSVAPGWTDVVTRRHLRAGPNDAVVLPMGSSGTVDEMGNPGGVAFGGTSLAVNGDDRELDLLPSGAGAWPTRVVFDKTPPAATGIRLDAPILRGFTGGASVPVRILAADEGDIATAAIFVDARTADDRAGFTM